MNTDSSGFARVALYDSGATHASLLFRLPEHYTATIEVPPDCQSGDHYLGRVDLRKKPILASGVVLMPDGTPVPWAKIGVTHEAQETRSLDWKAMTGKDGSFHLYKGLPKQGPYALHLIQPPTPGFDLPAPVPFVKGQQGLILRLAPIETDRHNETASSSPE